MENNTLIQNAKAIATRYSKFTGNSVKIEMGIWEHGRGCLVKWELSDVGDICKIHRFESFTELYSFVVGEIAKKEILFRKFS